MDNKLISPKLNRFDARQLFNQGKVVFYEDAILARGIVSKDSPVKDLAKKIAPFSRPTTGSGEPQALLWGHLVAVFSKDGADAAGQFARFITSDTETAVKYFKVMSLPPVTTAALAADDVKNDTYTIGWGDKITKTARAHPFCHMRRAPKWKRSSASRCKPCWLALPAPRTLCKRRTRTLAP